MKCKEAACYAKTSELAQQLVGFLSVRKRILALAESCTAGLVSGIITQVSGASQVLWGTYVCYSPAAKTAMLGIDSEFLTQHGMVSRPTAAIMAQQTLKQSKAAIAAAVTGLAGPNGDGSSTPVGTVWVAAAWKEKGNEDSAFICQNEKEYHFSGTRQEIRVLAAEAVLNNLLDIIKKI
ncbi:MAG: CinA family protein [Treponema sp.]|nr:CinA family protein [Treponema sp.]